MDSLKRLQAALQGRYAVEQELGRGGMAVVYLGRDLRLDRRVAIKVFEAEGRGGQVTERFLREIRIAAQLQHPNILPVFESGEAEGLVYYVMPYVAGASLRERLEREGALPIAEAVRIAREVAEALDHAHRAGIVHRDIKPDNVMLSGGVAVVADFGIARAREQGGGKLTDTGLAIGTPNYMSPEQATAQPTVDGRADIYALGCVLYEMLAGAPPFSGPTAQAVMARHTADAVPPLSTVRQVPEALEMAVLKALAKLPVDRWETGQAFADALTSALTTPVATRRSARSRQLRRATLAALPVLAAVAIAWQLWSRRAAAVGPELLKSVAVLPFTTSGDTSQAILAEGLAEGVTTGLVRVEGLGVLSSGRMRAYRDRGADAREVGRELGASAVVTLAVQVAGNRLRVTAQLTDVSSGLLHWSEQFNGELLVNGRLQDVFTIQDEITSKIVDALHVRLASTSRAALARGVRTRDAVAYDLYLRARRATYELTLADVQRAIALFEQALARDSTFAEAWVALADAYGFLAQFGNLTPAEAAVRMRRAVERGIALDSSNGYAYALRGNVRSVYDWDWDGAWSDMRRAVRLSPASADVALNYAFHLNNVAEPESALAHMRRGVGLDPTNSFMLAGLGMRFRYIGMADSAIAAFERALALDSTQWVASAWLDQLYEEEGRHVEGEREAARVLRYAGDSVRIALVWLAEYYGVAGQRQRGRDVLDRLTVLARRQYVPPVYIAIARLAVGDRVGALDALEEAARNRDFDLAPMLPFDLGALSGEPRYEAVRRTVFGDRRVPRGWPRHPTGPR